VTDYRPPLDDIRFVLAELVDLPGIVALPGFEHAAVDAVDDVLAEAARFAAEVIAPTNRDGDTVGARWHDGEVTTAPGFADAYAQYVAAGWGAVSADPEHGGGGFPKVVGTVIDELVTTANMAFSLCPLLTAGGVHLLEVHGSAEQQRRWLPRMVTGEWSGTMNLTEPQAGSDVGALTTRAVRQDDGSYRITGTKIYITYGEHDMARNIVHIVLARTPGSPPGTKGISLFIVPKFVLGPDGEPAERNTVHCVSIEHKMGLHGSPTCVLSFEDAVGDLIGDEGDGMRQMFLMMNDARLGVGVEGLAIAERAYQQALAYAHERHQGRAPGTPAGQDSPIVEHPDVRRMLLTMKAYIDAMRPLCYANAAALDLARRGADEDTRRAGQELADLYTPITKAWCTDLGSEVASLGIQVHGGMGYIEETGAAQHYRDARIAAIYEGTNGIQAIDLVGRKLPMRAGAVVGEQLDAARTAAAGLRAEGEETAASELERAADEVGAASAWLLAAEPGDRLAGATPYLRALGTVVGGTFHARAFLAPSADEGRRTVARFFLTQLLPQAGWLARAAVAGNGDLATARTTVLA
jgi:3-(methylthio)propanoyl-CoA dehydrogenase